MVSQTRGVTFVLWLADTVRLDTLFSLECHIDYSVPPFIGSQKTLDASFQVLGGSADVNPGKCLNHGSGSSAPRFRT